MSDQPIFRAWLKRLRQERGLTQEELGELVGYAAQTIRKIEGGQRRPSPQLALRLAQALQLPSEQHPAWMAALRAGVDPEAAEPEEHGLRAPTPSPGLPLYLTPFVGREQERAALAELLGRPDCRLVTVLGQGGVGKTRLAIETARVVPGFQDGVAFVSLAPVAAPEAIVPAVAEALGFTFVGAGDLVTQLVGHLRERRVLLLLDNMEHLLDPRGVTLELLGLLLAQAPEVAILATSRERLRVAGEWVLELEGLPVPQPHTRAQPESPALRLFVEHAERVDRGFRLTATNQSTAGAICRLVDGLPLGIELAAAWTRLLSLDEIAQELARNLDAAHLSSGMLPERHRSLRSVVEHSWQLLSEPERAALRRLAVFQGGFTREAAVEVAGAGLEVLANLADKSLLRRGASGRYDLHEIIRQYADGRLQERPDERAATRDRHAAYYLRLVAERDQRLKGAEQEPASAEIIAEIDNVRAAWLWGAAHAPLDVLERAAEVLQWFCEFRSWLREGTTLFSQAIEQLRFARGADNAALRQALGRLLSHYSYLAARYGEIDNARAAAMESCELLADGQDPVGLARALAYHGIITHWIGDYAEVRRLLDRSLALAISTGELYTQAFCRSWASINAHAIGDYAEAERLFRAALAGWRAIGSPRATIWCITYCSTTLMALGKYDEAQQLLRETLTLSHATDDRYGTAMTLHHLGLVALHQGGFEEAIYFFREALPLVRSTSGWEYPQACNDLATALAATGSVIEARRAYHEALSAALKSLAIPEALRAVVGLAAGRSAGGEHAVALGLAARVLADPASKEESRRSAAMLYQTALLHLPAEVAMAVEQRWRGLPLAAIPTELSPS